MIKAGRERIIYYLDIDGLIISLMEFEFQADEIKKSKSAIPFFIPAFKKSPLKANIIIFLLENGAELKYFSTLEGAGTLAEGNNYSISGVPHIVDFLV